MLNGKRSSTYAAFLANERSRPNLHIATRALVEKVLIDNAKRAYAVQYNSALLSKASPNVDRDARRRVVRARKEIILSAGAIGSPQILLLSGVGPREHLNSLGVLHLNYVNGSYLVDIIIF